MSDRNINNSDDNLFNISILFKRISKLINNYIIKDKLINSIQLRIRVEKNKFDNLSFEHCFFEFLIELTPIRIQINSNAINI